MGEIETLDDSKLKFSGRDINYEILKVSSGDLRMIACRGFLELIKEYGKT